MFVAFESRNTREWFLPVEIEFDDLVWPYSDSSDTFLVVRVVTRIVWRRELTCVYCEVTTTTS